MSHSTKHHCVLHTILTSIAMLFIFTATFGANRDIDYGFRFNAKSEDKDNRATFELDEVVVDDYLKLTYDWSEFDLGFGYINRVVINNDINIDVIVSMRHDDMKRSHMIVVAKDSTIYESEDITKDKWQSFELIVKPQQDSIYVNNKGIRFEFGISSKSQAKIFFGAKREGEFSTYDVASINIRNIGVWLEPSEMKWNWRLNKYSNDKTIDEVDGKTLLVKNGEWLINEHFKWEKVFTASYSPSTHVISDQNNKLFVINDDSLTVVNLTTFSNKTTPLDKKIKIDAASNQFIYDTLRKRLCYYSIDRFENVTYSTYNPTTQMWVPRIDVTKDAAYQHSTLFISPLDSTLHQLFGYGFHRYNSKHFEYNPQSDKMLSHDHKNEIPPRYLSAAGRRGDDMYILGGFGHKSGNQEMGAHPYNDVYRYNLRNGKIQKDSTIIDIGIDNVATNLLFTENDERALALVYTPIKYESGLVLNEIDFDSGVVKPLADTINYYFNDISSYSNLIYQKEQRRLLAYTKHKTKGDAIELNIYTIGYPAINSSDAIICTNDDNHNALKRFFWIIIFVLASIAIYILIRKKDRSKTNNYVTPHRVVVNTNIEGASFPEIKRPDTQQAGIYLLGGFCVINKDGVDITGQFSPMMRQLLCLVIMTTQANDKGILSVKLKEYLWYDKSDDSARNNRGVVIRKIRVLLESVGDFKIVSQNNYWKVEYGDGAYCNYTVATDFLNNLPKDTSLNEQQLCELITVAHMGNLVPNQQLDFFDRFKAEYTDRIITTLKREIPFHSNSEAILQLAESILIFDCVDEDAIRTKCQVLVARGQIGIAEGVFKKFTWDYETLMGTKFEKSFDIFISNGINDENTRD